ncbi:hypothetical protein BSU01_14355 [Erwinia billingiae]|uniref:helix-turn-helix domain-containing protein n=1 Tax=Erwinia billingiae TaxID=182337 RepID=UPI0019D0F1E8|nr:hypothetical protein [Erwinia billingiae]
MRDEFLVSLGNRLKTLRMDKSLTQSELSLKSSLDRTYISNLENGKRNPSILSLRRIAYALEVPIEKLLTESKNRVL